MRGQVSKQRDAGEILRFAREQSRRLVGEHIVAPYAWAVDDGTAVIALELIAGGSLRTLSGDHGPLAEGTIVTVLDQVLDALATVHAAGIVHRDVTCGNILVRSTGFDPIDVALTDFGIAIALADAPAHHGGIRRGHTRLSAARGAARTVPAPARSRPVRVGHHRRRPHPRP